MHSMKPINRKARKVEAAVIAATGDVQALQRRGAEGKIYYPMGCTLNERDLFDCHLGCGWPAQVPDHLNNAVDWTDKCASATNDWRKIDIVFP